MIIPGTIVKKHGERYKFIARYGDLFLYENEKTKVKETFNRHDLKKIDNSEIDKLLNIKKNAVLNKSGNLIMYDKELDKEFEFHTQTEIAQNINVSCKLVHIALKNKKWIKQRYFVEYKEGKDERD